MGARESASPKGNERAQRRYLARRLEILRAAGKAFRTRGFAETGMRDIAAAADLSPANLYNYFRGKDEILFFCQDVSLDRLLAALESVRRSRHSTAEKLRIVIGAHLRCVLDEIEGSAAHLFAGGLAPKLQDRLIAKRDRYEDGVRQLIAGGIRNGEFAACDAALAARAILGALNWSVRWYRPGGTLSANEIAERFADFLIRGLSKNAGTIRHAARNSKMARNGRAVRLAEVNG
ncbi:MAG TPA: TetR/AcrR family transcriptional regulator [Candidatus Acidoferrales bacterium]|nr:TetR/AcrR family transcriptional regulator [Candidatus Acidoferrales bacterium]